MTKKNVLRSLIILQVTLILMWVLPWLYTTAARDSFRLPFTYYSTLKKDFITYDNSGERIVYRDSKGDTYTTQELDSILPVLNYRQLLKDGRFPDTINGIAIEPKMIQHSFINYRYSPRRKNSKSIGLYTMFESMSGRVNLEQPTDFFALKDDIHFIDAETNMIDHPKSDLFQTAMEKQKFQFPAQWVVGNSSAKKAYDEGWFAMDSKDELYQVKMVNGKPFVKNCNIPKDIQIEYMSTLETAGHLTYGFIFTTDGKVYYLEDITYKPIRVEAPKLNLETDQFSVLGNLFYWNVYVTTPEGRSHWALDTETMTVVDSLELNNPTMKWQQVMAYIFPCTLSFNSSNSNFINAYFSSWSWNAIYLNIICVLLLLFIYRSSAIKSNIASAIFVAITGVFGLIAVLLFREQSKGKTNIIQLK